MGDGAGVVTSTIGTNTVHPVGLVALLFMCMLFMALPRRRAMVVLFLCFSFVPVGQRFVLMTIDFPFFRIMLFFGMVRVLMRGEFSSYVPNRLDYMMFAWTIVSTIMFSISQVGSSPIGKIGSSIDLLNAYFLTRFLVRDLVDVNRLISGLAMMSAPIMCFFLIEWSTSRNLFGFMGGVPEITAIRDGKLRCQGAYAHPILGGCYWAALLPLFLGRIVSGGKGRLICVVGAFSSLAIIAMCNSSTAALGALAGMLGIAAFKIRNGMVVVRWAVVAMAISLHFIMKAPVWHLIARLDFMGGQSWHRYHVIDCCIRYVDEWIVAGTPNIDHWQIYDNDLTNQYALEGVRGGGLSLLLYLCAIAVAFGNVGRLHRKVPPPQVMLAWSIGVSLFVHTVNFFGVSYWGQLDSIFTIALGLTTVAASPDPRGMESVDSEAYGREIRLAHG